MNFRIMFGFMFNQPIHKTLRDMRVIQIFSIAFSFWLLYDLISWYKQVADLSVNGDAAFLAFAGALVGTIWKAVSSINEIVTKDDDDDDFFEYRREFGRVGRKERQNKRKEKPFDNDELSFLKDKVDE